MAFRNIVVENPARITARNKQLIITTDAEHSVAIEDISALLLEGWKTVKLLSAQPHCPVWGSAAALFLLVTKDTCPAESCCRICSIAESFL